MTGELDPHLLRRLRDHDLTAWAEFCDTYLPVLLVDRRWVPAGVQDEHMVEEAVHLVLMDFVRHPERYDPNRLPIYSYLRMMAAGDVRNLAERERRHALRRAPIDSVELRAVERNDEQQTAEPPDGVSQDLILRRLREVISDERDWTAALMMIDGVRETAAYARVYGLTDLPKPDQEREVKRHKGRLDKRMKRLGKRLRDDR